MKLGISTACLYPEVVEKALEELLNGGAKVLEIFINSHSELKEEYLKDLKRKADSYNAEIVSLHPFTCGLEPMMFFSAYERRFTDMIEYYKLYFNAMNILEAGIFVFHGNNKLNTYSNEKYFERFSKLAEVGKSFGITVAQENVARCTSSDINFLNKMSQELGDDAKFVFDLKQARRSDVDIFEFISTLKDKIVHIHYSDGSNNNDCLPYGKGKLDNIKFINELKRVNFKGNIITELYRENFKMVSDLMKSFTEMRIDCENILCPNINNY